ncbi:MAG: hypothetical protein H6839_12955 [Planctomycetes bacterium]|nr:hypothetical protein [Planctomycetota bacterium]
MRTVLLLLISGLLALTAAMPANAKDDPKPEADPYVLFRVAGRKWMIKRTPNASKGFENNQLNYQEFEVMASYDDRADVEQLSYDKTKKPTTNDPIKLNVEFSQDALLFKDPVGYNKSKIDKVKTDVGTFECTLWTKNGPEGNSSMWRSNDFPGLVVKLDDPYGNSILIDFDWVEGDPGYKDTSKKKKKDEDEKIDPKRLYSNKGATWILQSDTTRGERGTRTIEVTQYEVKKVSDEECEVEVTRLSQLLQKIKGEDEQTLIIKFDAGFEDNLKPKERSRKDRVEKRITKVGLMTCDVYSYKDEEGREAFAWYAQEWPGLVVRRVVTGEDYKQVTEIIKFEE